MNDSQRNLPLCRPSECSRGNSGHPTAINKEDLTIGDIFLFRNFDGSKLEAVYAGDWTEFILKDETYYNTCRCITITDKRVGWLRIDEIEKIILREKELCDGCIARPTCNKMVHARDCYKERIKNDK